MSEQKWLIDNKYRSLLIWPLVAWYWPNFYLFEISWVVVFTWCQSKIYWLFNLFKYQILSSYNIVSSDGFRTVKGTVAFTLQGSFLMHRLFRYPDNVRLKCSSASSIFSNLPCIDFILARILESAKYIIIIILVINFVIVVVIILK